MSLIAARHGRPAEAIAHFTDVWTRAPGQTELSTEYPVPLRRRFIYSRTIDTVIVRIEANAIRDLQGRVEHYLVAIEDITAVLAKRLRVMDLKQWEQLGFLPAA